MGSKDLYHNLPYRRRGQLVHALKHACNDGDFQWCKLDSDTIIEVTSTRAVGRRIVRSTKVFGIEEFAAAAPFIYNGEA